MAQFIPAELFGGAVVSRIPIGFKDASNFREVPDSQEVYVSMIDGVDISIIFDITQRVEAPTGPSDMDAVELHFEDAAVDQGRTVKVWSKRGVVVAGHPDKPAYQVIGTVSARPTDKVTDPPTFTAIIMTVLRLAQQKTDIVITVNVPFDDPEVVRKERCIASPVYTGDDISPESGARSELLELGMKVAEEVVGGFMIKDWGLFV